MYLKYIYLLFFIYIFLYINIFISPHYDERREIFIRYLYKYKHLYIYNRIYIFYIIYIYNTSCLISLFCRKNFYSVYNLMCITFIGMYNLGLYLFIVYLKL